MPTIPFKTELFNIGDWTILLLPQSASAQLPSRGMTLVKGTINGHDLLTALEPDGNGSHWFKVDKALREAIGAKAGDTVTLEIASSKEWPEPEIPADLQAALAADPEVHTLWSSLTPMARWDWIRWIRATNRQETRAKRIVTAFSKLRAGERRPCCFNRNLCTEPSVSKNGALLAPTQPTK